jgi:cation diffusion facilitator family transporter
MNAASELASRSVANHEKRRVAISSVLAAILLTTLKLVVGISTQSLGILSEAAHSALDLLAAGVTCWAVHVSGRPADQCHTYGHGKVENLSALFETLLLLLTCVWIIYESIHRLFYSEVEVLVNFWSFAVVAVSILIDVSRSRALMRMAKKHQSQALEADALHFSTDVWSSCIVFLGLVGVLAGRYFDMPWLVKADAVAALGVAMIVIWIGIQLGKRSIGDLLDAVPMHQREDIAAIAARVPGVEFVTQVRLRRSGPEFFADITLAIDPAATVERGHEIANQTEKAVREVVPGADVTVHVEPVASRSLGLLTTIRMLAARRGIGAHGIRIYEEHENRSVELHLEVNESLSLREAHQLASDFEHDLRASVPGMTRIVTHLEPSGDSSATIPAATTNKAEIRAAIEAFMEVDDRLFLPHDIQVQSVGGELSVSFHCSLDPGTAITAAHELTEQLEKHLRSKIAGLGRVVIHVEPVDASP